jgi:uncharacterized protein YPO0396
MKNNIPITVSLELMDLDDDISAIPNYIYSLRRLNDDLAARVAKLEAALNHVLKMQTRGYVRFGAEFNKMADEAIEDKS